MFSYFSKIFFLAQGAEAQFPKYTTDAINNCSFLFF